MQKIMNFLHIPRKIKNQWSYKRVILKTPPKNTKISLKNTKKKWKIQKWPHRFFPQIKQKSPQKYKNNPKNTKKFPIVDKTFPISPFLYFFGEKKWGQFCYFCHFLGEFLILSILKLSPIDLKLNFVLANFYRSWFRLKMNSLSHFKERKNILDISLAMGLYLKF